MDFLFSEGISYFDIPSSPTPLAMEERKMSGSFSHLINRIAEEPPFRILSQKFVKYFIGSLRQKARWEAVERPNYLSGLLKAADQAMSQNIKEIVAIEFGEAAGGGLVAWISMLGKLNRKLGLRCVYLVFRFWLRSSFASSRLSGSPGSMASL
ncbi:MAG: hypothetical protein H6750_15320 [Nitrospiraceae bacterium]|nr:hypothetical protein [Nitrospiraceae bacterium]